MKKKTEIQPAKLYGKSYGAAQQLYNEVVLGEKYIIFLGRKTVHIVPEAKKHLPIKKELQELIAKYKIMVGNLVYDSEEERLHKHVDMILKEMSKDQAKYE